MAPAQAAPPPSAHESQHARFTHARTRSTGRIPTEGTSGQAVELARTRSRSRSMSARGRAGSEAGAGPSPPWPRPRCVSPVRCLPRPGKRKSSAADTAPPKSPGGDRSSAQARHNRVDSSDLSVASARIPALASPSTDACPACPAPRLRSPQRICGANRVGQKGPQAKRRREDQPDSGVDATRDLSRLEEVRVHPLPVSLSASLPPLWCGRGDGATTARSARADAFFRAARLLQRVGPAFGAQHQQREPWRHRVWLRGPWPDGVTGEEGVPRASRACGSGSPASGWAPRSMPPPD